MIITNSAAETRTLGERLAQQLKAGDVILLEGELGAGKSELARGVAKGLGVQETVTSPSFTILNGWKAPKNCMSSAWTSTWAGTGLRWWNGRANARTQYRKTA